MERDGATAEGEGQKGIPLPVTFASDREEEDGGCLNHVEEATGLELPRDEVPEKSKIVMKL